MKTRIVLTIIWLALMANLAFISNEVSFVKVSSLNDFIGLALLSIKSSVIACAWVLVLTEGDMLFSWFRLFVNRIAEAYYLQNDKMNYKRKDFTDTLMKPFLTCEICTTANLAFFTYSSSNLKHFVILDLISTISLSILLTLATQKTWTNNK